MSTNPDIYLLYEYMDKVPFTARVKVSLDDAVDVGILIETAQEAIVRFPYFSVKLDIDEGQNFVLKFNSKPITVLPEKDSRMMLGSDEVNEHLFTITYRDNTIWFNWAHTVCGGFGVMFWIKTTLYLYMCKKYGCDFEPPKDIKMPGTPVSEGELAFPDPNTLPDDEPVKRYNGGDTNLAIGRHLKYLLNPFAKQNYYYEIEIPSKSLIDYAKSIDASPNTLFVAMMYKAMTRFLKEKEGTFISGRVCADYRKDIGVPESYRDFVRFIHIKYEWGMKEESISKLNMRARGDVITQDQPELSVERFRRLVEAHKGIDEQPDLKAKKKYAAAHSTFRNDPRDIYTVSYVGQLGFGEIEKHITGIYNITDGDFMLEVNALKDKFCICFQLLDKNRKPLELFLDVLKGEGVEYKVSDIKTRFMPRIKFP